MEDDSKEGKSGSEVGCTVNIAPGDADVLIIKAAVEKSLQHTTTLIEENTDLIVLLLYYAQDVNKGLYLRSDKSQSHGNFTVYDSNRLKEFLGPDIYSQLFIHAVTGCDLTAQIISVGKKTAFQKLLKGDSVLRSCANTSSLLNQTMAVIDDLKCHAMAVLFGGNGTDSLATMRYNTLSRTVVTSSLFVTPQCLNLLLSFTVAGRTTRSAAVRVVTGAKKFDHITPVLPDLHWLPVRQRIKYKLAMTVYKCIRGLAPTYLAISAIAGKRHLRSARTGMLSVSRTTTTLGMRSFAVAGPVIWNSLPAALRTATLTALTFARHLKALSG